MFGENEDAEADPDVQRRYRPRARVSRSPSGMDVFDKGLRVARMAAYAYNYYQQRQAYNARDPSSAFRTDVGRAPIVEDID